MAIFCPPATSAPGGGECQCPKPPTRPEQPPTPLLVCLAGASFAFGPVCSGGGPSGKKETCQFWLYFGSVSNPCYFRYRFEFFFSQNTNGRIGNLHTVPRASLNPDISFNSCFRFENFEENGWENSKMCRIVDLGHGLGCDRENRYHQLIWCCMGLNLCRWTLSLPHRQIFWIIFCLYFGPNFLFWTWATGGENKSYTGGRPRVARTTQLRSGCRPAPTGQPGCTAHPSHWVVRRLEIIWQDHWPSGGSPGVTLATPHRLRQHRFLGWPSSDPPDFIGRAWLGP